MHIECLVYEDIFTYKTWKTVKKKKQKKKQTTLTSHKVIIMLTFYLHHLQVNKGARPYACGRTIQVWSIQMVWNLYIL